MALRQLPQTAHDSLHQTMTKDLLPSIDRAAGGEATAPGQVSPQNDLIKPDCKYP